MTVFTMLTQVIIFKQRYLSP